MQDIVSNISAQRESSRDIDLAAAHWAARCDRGRLSVTEQAALDAWKLQDSRRAGAFARAMAISIAASRHAAAPPAYEAAHPPRRQFLRAAAAIGAISLAGLASYRLWAPTRQESTPRGGIRMVPLDDGSTATLNTDTVIDIAYDERSRRVTLRRGEALFTVAKDAGRPFLVEANGVVVRAIGTSFSVRTVADNTVDIVMREGVVDVRRGSDGATSRMGAQTRMRVDTRSGLRVQPVSAEAVDRALAWKAGQIDLNGLTMAQAVQEFARYSDRRITIDTPRIAAMKVTGLYSASDPDGFAESAALALGLTAERGPRGTVIRAN